MKQEERYERQIAIPQIGKVGQQRLGQAKVLVVGAGGLGSPVLTYLVRAGVGYLTIVDEDIVSVSNLNRQFFYTHEDIGKPKANLASERLQLQNPNIKICPIVERITEKNGVTIIAEHDIVVDCVDNMKTRLLLNSLCLQANIPLVEAGIQDFYGFVTVVHRDGPCLECMGFREETEQVVTPTLGATAGIIGSMQALECIKIILGMDNILYGKMLQYDGISGIMDTITVQQSECCELHQFQLENILVFEKTDKRIATVSSATLLEALGLEGDKHAKGGDKQLTILGNWGKQWIGQEIVAGLCFPRCKANVEINGSIKHWKVGDRIRIGKEAVIEITNASKECFPTACERTKEELACLLGQELRYAKVVKSGNVVVGDIVDLVSDMK